MRSWSQGGHPSHPKFAHRTGDALGEGVDLALVVIGANDLAGFASPTTGARQLHDAVARLVRAGRRKCWPRPRTSPGENRQRRVDNSAGWSSYSA